MTQKLTAAKHGLFVQKPKNGINSAMRIGRGFSMKANPFTSACVGRK